MAVVKRERVYVNGKKYRRRKYKRSSTDGTIERLKVYDPIQDETIVDWFTYDNEWGGMEVRLPIMNAKVSDPTRRAIAGIIEYNE